MTGKLSYSEAIKLIDTIPFPNTNETVERMNRFSKIIGEPHTKLNSFLIGGTNGKGSTCLILYRLLINLGFKVGLLHKPHIYRFNERCIVNDLEIEDEELAFQVSMIIDKLSTWDVTPPELRYLTWFKYMVDKNVDFLVCEVNEGGRNDVTNILTPNISIITNVGLDHQETLGNTVSEIAYQKAGIIKEKGSVITGATGESLKVIEEEAHNKGALIWRLGKEIDFNVNYKDKNKYNFDVNINGYIVKDISLNLSGDFQVKNATLAIAAYMKQFNKSVDKLGENVTKTLPSINLPGRVQLVNEDPVVILDGAHNFDKASALVKTIKTQYPKKKIISVVSMSTSRIKPVIDGLKNNTDFFIACESRFERAAPSEAIMNYIEEINHKGIIILNVNEAVNKAIKLAKTMDAVIVVTGAFITLGEVCLKENKMLER